MFEYQYAENLKHPRGIIGRIVARWFVENQIAYSYLEEIDDLSKYKRILEIGYGTGDGILRFANKYDGRIDGIDISKLKFKYAKRKNAKWINKGKVKIYLGTFESLSPSSYDFVYLINVIYFWDEIESRIKTIYDLLKPNGRMVLFMANPEYLLNGKQSSTNVFNKYVVEEVVNVINNCNFKEISVIEHKEEKKCYYIFGTKKE
jgi:SAM-dependent methyltransferase